LVVFIWQAIIGDSATAAHHSVFIRAVYRQRRPFLQRTLFDKYNQFCQKSHPALSWPVVTIFLGMEFSAR
jgi:hypothetical protein